MGIDTVKEANRQKFQKTDRKQDHGTRGTDSRDRRSIVSMEAEDAAKRRKIEETIVIDEHFVGQPEFANATQNIEIKRRIRKRISEMVKESVSQWRSIWGEDPYKIATSLFPINMVFQQCRRLEGSIYYIFNYGGQNLRIRPSEIKLYKQLKKQFPEKDKDGNLLNSLSYTGERELKLQLTALGALNSSGVTPLAMERAFIAKQVRAEMKKTRTNREPSVDFEDKDIQEEMIDQVVLQEESPVGWRPQTKEEQEEARSVRKEKYFGSR